MQKPVLKARKIDVVGVRGQCGLVVHGGLNYIRGNALPHFSLTCEIVQGRRDIGGGADHATILKYYPELSDLAALHLSDSYGLPMHAVENAWYWLCGAVEGGRGERYHAGNSGTPKTPDQCLAALARHLRIDMPTAERLCNTSATKADLAAWIETQKPRYTAEAEAAVATHGLRVFGDPWDPRGGVEDIALV